jgi:phosphate/sulfate permease
MAVVAALAVGAAHYWKGVSGDQDAIGRFVIVSCLAPLLLMFIASLIFRIIRKLSS